MTLAYTLPAPHTWQYPEDSDSGDIFGSTNEEYDAAYHSYVQTTEILTIMGAVTMDIGMLLLLLMAFFAPFSRSVSYEDKRLFLILGVVLVFIFVIQLRVGMVGRFMSLF